MRAHAHRAPDFGSPCLVRFQRYSRRVSYDHVLLPAGAAATADDVDAYYAAQHGQPTSAAISAIAAGLNRHNSERPESDTFLSVVPLNGGDTGTVLHVPSPWDAVGFVRQLIFDLATPLDYAVYDPQLNWLIDPAGHIPVTVMHGNAGEFPYLTHALATKWVAGLAEPNPFLIVERQGQGSTYIQTSRGAAA